MGDMGGCQKKSIRDEIAQERVVVLEKRWWK